MTPARSQEMARPSTQQVLRDATRFMAQAEADLDALIGIYVRSPELAAAADLAATLRESLMEIREAIKSRRDHGR